MLARRPESLAPTPAELTKVTISGSVDVGLVSRKPSPTPSALTKAKISGSVDAGPLEPSLSPTSLASMSDAMAARVQGSGSLTSRVCQRLSAENWSLRLYIPGYDAVVEDVLTEEQDAQAGKLEG